ncbi:MAG: Lsa family ABC-F type ribosomal protection protein [Enterococcus sp.]
MSNIEIKKLSFGYDSQGTMLFDEADLNMESTWKLGLIGRNGRGKTTLLNILQNKLAYSGQIVHQQEFVYFPQKIEDPTQLTYYALEEHGTFEQWEIERELQLMEVNPDILWRPFQTLSGGEKTKVLLALLFVDEAHYPLIDEPTNHLDSLGRQQVAAYLKKKKRGFIVVSHDRTFVDEVVDHILAIEKSQLVLYQGNFSTYETQKKHRDEFEIAQNEKLKKEIGRLKQTAAEKSEWSHSREKDKYGNPHQKGSGYVPDTGFVGARAARVMKRSKSLVHRMDQQATEKEKLLKDIETVDQLTMNFQPTHRKLLLSVEDLQVGYEEQPLFLPVDFQLQKGERLALIGGNGAGKSTLLHTLLGDTETLIQGKVSSLDTLKISYVRQDYEDNQGTLQAFAEENKLDYEAFLNNLRKLGMEREVFANRIEQMSMGQRKKVELAKSLAQEAELYIWDEPLNYLDVFNQQQLEQLILSVQPTMLLVEHDRHFLDTVSSKKVVLEPISSEK